MKNESARRGQGRGPEQGAGAPAPARAPELPRLERAAATALALYGVLVLAAAFTDLQAEAGMVAGGIFWSFVHFVIVMVLAWALLRGQPMARLGAGALAVVVLIVLLPLLVAMLGGPGIDRLLPWTDLTLMALRALALVVLLVLLLRMRRVRAA